MPIHRTRRIDDTHSIYLINQPPISVAKRILTMRKNKSIAIALLLLIASAPILGACNTTAGAGQDLSATGHAVTNSAEKLKP